MRLETLVRNASPGAVAVAAAALFCAGAFLTPWGLVAPHAPADPRARNAEFATTDDHPLASTRMLRMAQTIRQEQPVGERSVNNAPYALIAGAAKGFVYLPHYRERVRELDARRAVGQPGGVYIVGDSHVEGWEALPLQTELSLENRGVGGDTTFGLINRLPRLIAEAPDAVFLMIGVNDLIMNARHGLTQRYELILRRLREALPHAELYVHSLLPVNQTDFPMTSEHLDNADIAAVNERLRRLCAEVGATYLDLAPAFLDETGRLRRELSLDGLHLNLEGYTLWAERMTREVESLRVKMEQRDSAPAPPAPPSFRGADEDHATQ